MRKEADFYERNNGREGKYVLWSEAVQNAERRGGSDGSLSQRGKSSADDKILGEPSQSGVSGDNERVWKASGGTESKVKNRRAPFDTDYLDADFEKIRQTG